jgi:hypothetical protein
MTDQTNLRLKLEIDGAYESAIFVVPDWVAASTTTCTADPEQGVGHTVDDVIAWLTSHPGLTTTTPEPVTIGGMSGQMVELTRDPGYTGPCLEEVNLFTRAGSTGTANMTVLEGSNQARLYMLEAPGGHTLSLYVMAPDDRFGAFVGFAVPVVESFTIEPPESTPSPS